jgi:hypothetical protein
MGRTEEGQQAGHRPTDCFDGGGQVAWDIQAVVGAVDQGQLKGPLTPQSLQNFG